MRCCEDVGHVVLRCNPCVVCLCKLTIRTHKCTNSVMQISECAVAESELSGLPPGRVRRVCAFCVQCI